MIKSLYVHIPFCHSICSYCDFKKVPYDQEVADYYISALERDLRRYRGKMEIQTLYVGGGTPSILTSNQIEQLCDLLSKYVKWDEIKEFTFECNPEDVTYELASKLVEVGVNRISLGAQTFNDNILKRINRRHTSKTTMSAFNIFREVGIKNISIDLIYGLEGQTAKDIEYDLNTIALLMPDHISWYSLIIKEGTELEGQQIDQTKEEELMEIAFEGLKKRGYNQYEISSFSRDKKHESMHNKAYWLTENWLGIGWGASSHIDGKLIDNIGTVVDWKEKVEVQDEEDRHFQVLMMGLRYFDGIPIKVEPYKSAYKYFDSKIHKLLLEGYVEILNGVLKVSNGKNMLLDQILLNLM